MNRFLLASHERPGAVVTKDDDRVLVCMRLSTPLIVPDNRIGRCSECGWKVQFRPSAPRYRKMCMECSLDLVPDDAEIELFPGQSEDLRYILGRKGH